MQILNKLNSISHQFFVMMTYNLKFIMFSIKKNKFLIVYASIHKHGNFGDDLNEYMIKALIGEKHILLRQNNRFNIFFLGKKRPFILFVGSVLKGDISNSIILGSGVMSKGDQLYGKPKKILSVRGPMTYKYLIDKQFKIGQVIKYGDPALLLPKIFNKVFEKEYKIGFIPHYIDKLEPKSKRLLSLKKIHFIDIQEKVETVISEILKCEFIISSSLHGLITADAFGIQSRWIKISNNVKGDGFKFRDYFLSVGRQNLNPYPITLSTNTEDLLSLFDSKEKFNFDQNEYYEFVLGALETIVNQ